MEGNDSGYSDSYGCVLACCCHHMMNHMALDTDASDIWVFHHY